VDWPTGTALIAQGLDRIAAHRRIARDQRQALVPGLRHQKPSNAVDGRQISNLESMRRGDRQLADTRLHDGCPQVVEWQRKFADPDFEDGFPNHDRADVDHLAASTSVANSRR
jgi:hypothetical protein